jgi:hypothetical protein
MLARRVVFFCCSVALLCSASCDAPRSNGTCYLVFISFTSELPDLQIPATSVYSSLTRLTCDAPGSLSCVIYNDTNGDAEVGTSETIEHWNSKWTNGKWIAISGALNADQSTALRSLVVYSLDGVELQRRDSLLTLLQSP